MIRTAGPGHFEDRTVSSAANPYLVLAAYLVAGLDGVAACIGLTGGSAARPSIRARLGTQLDPLSLRSSDPLPQR